MNIFVNIGKSLMWSIALLMAVFTAGCGSGGSILWGNIPSASSKAITDYSLDGATGVINEPAKTISVTVHFGNDVTGLVATFSSTGAVVKVGSTVQTSTATANNFSSPVTYTVTAAGRLSGDSFSFPMPISEAFSSFPKDSFG